MSLADCMRDLSDAALQPGGIEFTLFEPRDFPGFESDIAKKLHRSPNQTKSLLDAYDRLEDDNHYEVEPRVVREHRIGPDKITEIRVRVKAN